MKSLDYSVVGPWPASSRNQTFMTRPLSREAQLGD